MCLLAESKILQQSQALPISIQCIFLGYSQFHKGFKCLEPKSGRVYISRDVIFDESVFPFENFIQMLVLGLEKKFFFFLIIYSIQSAGV
jgi:hypothetical protein